MAAAVCLVVLFIVVVLKIARRKRGVDGAAPFPDGKLMLMKKLRP